MYSVDAYGKMLTDRLRTGAYVRALQKAIKPGSVVIDLGAGPGFFALLAIKLGARRVYAIEPDNVIQLASDCARANGISDQIDFIQERSTNIALPEKADVIVADLRGVLPHFGTNLPSVQDAHERLLAPDGVLIPARDHLWAALAHAPATYSKLEAPWETHNDVSLAPARKLVMNSWFKSRIEGPDLLCDPVCWHSIDYLNIRSFDAAAQMTFVATRNGTAHGFVVWFDSELFEEVLISNAPGQPELIYGQAFFPLLQPIEVNVGDRIHFRIRADLIKDDYMWSWETRAYDQANTERAHFRQSTLLAAPLSQVQLKKRSSSFIPVLSSTAEISTYILSRIDGQTSIEELARGVAKEFPQHFSSCADALDTVAEVSAQYSK